MPYTLETHLQNRRMMLSVLAGEIFGPGSSIDYPNSLLAPAEELDISKPLAFKDWKDYGKRHVVMNTGQEILKDEKPTSRYGLGILFPEIQGEAFPNSDALEEDTAAEESVLGMASPSEKNGDDGSSTATAKWENLQKRADRIAGLEKGDEDSGLDLSEDESDLRLANLRKPRSMGVSFLADFSDRGCSGSN